jgi:(1->4)-alpha-D-glucan 1-alpha-D-glucosylmutase
MSRFRVPVASYRLQLNSSFTFQNARAIAPYLAELGITDLYSSPILKARPGSTHGYDVVDAAELNPEIGSEDDFEALHQELDSLGLGLLLDIVPNHMAASPDNSWWMSVLENGPRSRFFHYFDIDWSPVTSQGKTMTKVLLPILGKPYGEAVENQEIRLGFDDGGFFFSYFDHRLPLAPESYRPILRECLDWLPSVGVGMELRELVVGEATVPNSRFLKDTLWRIFEHDHDFRAALVQAIARFNGQKGNAESFNAIDALLDAQWYRLAYWRIASEKINYRRFFDVTDLIGVRVEDPEVFEARNRRTLQFIADGKVTGLRIDHIDGLFDPIGHMRKLQLRLAETGSTDEQRTATEEKLSFYVVVEKILAHGERLPEGFPVSGTTGYDFLGLVNSVFVHSDGLRSLTEFYRTFSGTTDTFGDIVYERKRQVISELFAGEMRALGKQLSGLAMLDRNGRDFAPSELLAALTEITACMDVYRTYIREASVSESDRRTIHDAVSEARTRGGTAIDSRLFDFLERTLLLEVPSYMGPEREAWLAFVMRWQQFTGRVMAKGVEDTAFYNFNRLVSMNEVGGDPGRDPPLDGLAEFHQRNRDYQRQWPHTLNASSTHDTKRSEDVRARINVLSEMPQVWAREVRRWSSMLEPLRVRAEVGSSCVVVPDRNEEILLFQTLVGVWPLGQGEGDSLPDRLRAYVEKAAREAKTHTSWIAPHAEYEKALLEFVDRILHRQDATHFREDLLRFQKRVAFYGFLNALAQLVLKITAPGVPDFYQGTELWDFSLVDPDNRRPVDYEKRRSIISRLQRADEKGSLDPLALARSWRDGRVKLFATWRALRFRRENAELFAHGSYEPVTASGHDEMVCAFRRDHGESGIIVVVPRFVSRLVKVGTLPVGDVWGDGSIEGGVSKWRNVFTGDVLDPVDGRLGLSSIFARFPVAILAKQ